jgi:hypothetical protein
LAFGVGPGLSRAVARTPWTCVQEVGQRRVGKKKQIGLVGRLNMRCTLIPLHRLQLFAKRVIIQLTISVERMFYGAWICFFHWVVRCSRTACPACATGLWAVDADKPWAVAAGEALAGAAGLQGEQPVKVERVYSWGFVRYGRSGKLCT